MDHQLITENIEKAKELMEKVFIYLKIYISHREIFLEIIFRKGFLGVFWR